MPDAPPAQALRLLRSQQIYALMDATPDRGLLLRVVAPVNVLSLADEPRALQLVQSVPQRLAQDAETVQTGTANIRNWCWRAQGLKRLYGITLTLTLLLALLAALAAAFLLSDELVRAARSRWPGHARGGAGRLQPPRRGGEPRRTGHADAVVQQHDRQLEDARARPSAIRPKS